jgi:hypothetical protein
MSDSRCAGPCTYENTIGLHLGTLHPVAVFTQHAVTIIQVYSRLMAAIGRPDMDANNPDYSNNKKRCDRGE